MLFSPYVAFFINANVVAKVLPEPTYPCQNRFLPDIIISIAYEIKVNIFYTFR
jgi:hypothetical protein